MDAAVVSRNRLRGARTTPARWAAGCVAVLVAICAGPAAARDGCVTLAPGMDGVLRLDRPRAPGWPCAGPSRVYAALPPDVTMPAPSPRPARPSPPQPGVTVAPPLPPASSADDLLRLNHEVARLDAELARLNDETVQLRAETRRLRQQLSRRDTGDIERAGPASGAQLQGRLAPDAPEPPAPQGDRADRTAAAAPGRDGNPLPRDATQGDARPAPSAPRTVISPDEIELARRKSVVERALGELRDLAARMRKAAE